MHGLFRGAAGSEAEATHLGIVLKCGMDLPVATIRRLDGPRRKDLDAIGVPSAGLNAFEHERPMRLEREEFVHV